MSITMDEPGAARRGELRKAFDEADRSDNGFFSGNSAFGKQFPRLIVAKLVIVLYACVVCSSIVEATSAPDGQASEGQVLRMDFNAIGLNDLPRLTSVTPPNAVAIGEQECAKAGATCFTPTAETKPNGNADTDNGAEQTSKDGNEWNVQAVEFVLWRFLDGLFFGLIGTIAIIESGLLHWIGNLVDRAVYRASNV